MTSHEVLQMIEIEIIQINDIEITQIIDHKIILTIDYIKPSIKIDPVTIPQADITTIKTNQETIINHHIETIHNI